MTANTTLPTTDILKHCSNMYNTSHCPNVSQTRGYSESLQAILDMWYYVHGLGGTGIALFGLLGNTICIFVLSNKRMRSSTALFLIFLAICDNLMLLFVIMLQTFPIICQHNDVFHSYIYIRESAYQVFYPIVHISHTGTIYTTIVVIAERFVAIVKPLKATAICTRSRAWKIIFVIFVWSILYNIPRCLDNTLRAIPDPVTNKTTYVTENSQFGQSSFYNSVYLVYLNFFFHFLLPFVTISVLNILILKTLQRRKSAIRGRRYRSYSLDEHRLTAMVLAMTVVFFVCQLFGAVQLLFLQVNDVRSGRIGDYPLSLEIFNATAETMVIVNSAFNFILFCVFGRKFRHTFLKCICTYQERSLIRINTQ